MTGTESAATEFDAVRMLYATDTRSKHRVSSHHQGPANNNSGILNLNELSADTKSSCSFTFYSCTSAHRCECLDGMPTL